MNSREQAADIWLGAGAEAPEADGSNKAFPLAAGGPP